jgi:diguanylate cyclase (GGDEF)-like protein/PAS domain S-box-containing protein
MKQQKKLKVFETSLISLLVIATVLAIVIGLKANSLLSDFNQTWENHIQEVEAKENILAEIRKHMGYGGLIHHFKNYVLRQSDDYLEALQTSKVSLLTSINEYQSYPLTPAEQQAVKQLLSVIEQYLTNISVAVYAQQQGWKSDKTDELVAIDDIPAYQALEQLDSILLKRLRHSRVELEATYDNGISLATIGFVAVVLLVFVTLVSIWFIHLLANEIRKRRENECQLYMSEAAIQASTNAISIADDDGNIVFVNPAFETITGYSSSEVIGKNPSILASGRHEKGFYRQMWKKLLEDGRWQGEVWNRHKSGELYLEWIDIIKFPSKFFHTGRYLAVFSDITSRKKKESLKAFQATHDPLTNLPNRNLFFDRLQNELLSCSRTQTKLAMLFLDLDKFKAINDNLGHLVGDEVLVTTSNRILNVIRQTDSVCRYGGDEFIILLPGIHSKLDWKKVVNNLLAAISEPYSVDEHELEITTSIGVAVHSPDDDEISPEDFIRLADEAMYQAKVAGKNQYAIAGRDNA